MFEFNQENIDAIINSLKALTIISEYDPNYSVDLHSLCINCSSCKHYAPNFFSEILENFFSSLCTITSDTVNDNCELFEFFKSTELLDNAVEYFLDEYNSDLELSESEINLLKNLYTDNFDKSARVFNEFSSFLSESYDINIVEISSPLFVSNSAFLSKFIPIFLYFISDSLIPMGYLMTYDIVKIDNTEYSKVIIHLDYSDHGSSIKDGIDDIPIPETIDTLYNHIQHIKKRQSQI